MLKLEEGQAARRGGLDAIVSLTRDQAAALDDDAALELTDALDTVLVALAALRSGRDPIRAGEPSAKDGPVTSGQSWREKVLRDVATLQVRLDGVQEAAMRAHAEAGGSYGALATAMGVARGTAQRRRDGVLSREPSAGELWARGCTAPMAHPGVDVPKHMRPWDVEWPAYLPPDITPETLRLPGLAASVADGWAEPYARPEDVPDWPARLKQAWIPFDLDDHGRPLNPLGRTGRTGQNFGGWGEIQMVDGIVVAGAGSCRSVLLVLRDDVEQWALPGGRKEKGESTLAAMLRELREETALDASAETPIMETPVVVDDWRNTDRAWAVSTAGLFELDETRPVTAGDDAKEVRWWPFVSLVQLLTSTSKAEGLYGPHLPLLHRAFERVTSG